MHDQTNQLARGQDEGALVMRACDDAAWLHRISCCTVADARRVFGLGDKDDGRDDLGEAHKPAFYQSLDDRPLRIWHRGLKVVLLDFEGLFEALDVGRVMGKPEARLPAAWGVATLDDGEWVYPTRGFAAVVLPSGVTAHVYGFAPISVASYARTVRVNMAKRPIPAPKEHRQ